MIEEPLLPDFYKIVPNIIPAAFEFNLEGKQGKFENWEQFGKWWYKNLIDGKQTLTLEDKQKVAELTADLKTPEEKIKVLYDYMQDKVRYISVQLGIGGLAPFSAEYVGQKSYGDCKALSNYMMSLLNEAGIKANYTRVFAGRGERKEFDEKFPYVPSNHVILNIPLENDTIWLENTDQKIPYNYLGDFTDGRKAFSVSETGGKVIKTQSFTPKDNQEIITGNGELDGNGSLKLNIINRFTGIKYGNHYRAIYQEKEEQSIYVKEKYSDIKGVEVNAYTLEDLQDKVEFKIEAELASKKYARIMGKNLIMPLIPTGKIKNRLKKDNTRKYPFILNYGYKDTSNFRIKVPQGFRLEEVAEPIKVESEFGSYALNYSIENSVLNVNREIRINQGTFPKEKYNDYIEFREQIEKMETQKILLTKE